MRPLEGIKVLDLTRALAGPFCATMLGDYGADVIKIERPGAGDDTRGWGPPFIGEESAYFLSVNRNKRSLTLNLRDEKAQQIFLKLAADADVIVENFTPDVMSNFNLGYDDVKQINPGIVYCSISGFGASGPYRDRPAYDQIMQGVSGLMSITGDLGGDPQKVGIAVTDIGAGMWAAFAVMAALFHRNSPAGKGAGQYIDLSMLDAQVAWMTYQAGYYFATGDAPQRLGAAHPTLVPYQGFKGGDGKFFNVAVGSERLWERFCQGINRMDLKDHPDYATNGDRVNHRSELVSLGGTLPGQGRRRLGCRPTSGERSRRPHQRPQGRVQRSSSATPRDAAGNASPDPRRHPANRSAYQVLRNPRRTGKASPPAGRAQPPDTQRPGILGFRY